MDFFTFCQDEAIKVKLEGEPIHRFFHPGDFLEFGLGRMRGEMEIRDLIIDLPIDEFLGLAEPIPPDDEKRHKSHYEGESPEEGFKREIAEGKKFDWSLPYLEIQPNEDEIWKVTGHDGRHRAILLKGIGYDTMPVHFSIPKGCVIPFSSELAGLPEILWCQNDRNAEREKDYYPFPITVKDVENPYCRIEGDEVLCRSKGAEDLSIVMDEQPKEGGTGEIGKAPIWCRRAKKNFLRNRVSNLAYRKDYTMPANTLKEYFAKFRH